MSDQKFPISSYLQTQQEQLERLSKYTHGSDLRAMPVWLDDVLKLDSRPGERGAVTEILCTLQTSFVKVFQEHMHDWGVSDVKLKKIELRKNRVTLGWTKNRAAGEDRTVTVKFTSEGQSKKPILRLVSQESGISHERSKLDNDTLSALDSIAASMSAIAHNVLMLRTPCDMHAPDVTEDLLSIVPSLSTLNDTIRTT